MNCAAGLFVLGPGVRLRLLAILVCADVLRYWWFCLRVLRPKYSFELTEIVRFGSRIGAETGGFSSCEKFSVNSAGLGMVASASRRGSGGASPRGLIFHRPWD